MKIKVEKIIANIVKGVIFPIEISYKAVYDHPFIVVSVLLLNLLYNFNPSLFGLLVSSSPVIICTTLLLGTLLSYGEPNIPEIEEEGKKTTHDVSALQSRGIADDIVVTEDDKILVEGYVESREEIKEDYAKSSLQVELSEDATVIKKDENFYEERSLDYRGDTEPKKDLVNSHCYMKRLESFTAHEEGKDNILIGATPSVEGKQQELHGEERRTTVGEASTAENSGSTLFHSENQDEDVPKRNQCDECGAGLFTDRAVGSEGVKLEFDEMKQGSCFYSRLHSAKKSAGGHADLLDSDSDGAESSSPDASLSDIIPMLDELHPLLDTELSRPVHIYIDDSDDSSEVSLQDKGSDYGSEEEEVAENQENDEDVPEEKDVENEIAVTWTADDEKNVMDLGTSELERNQRLENLIAKRRAKKLAESGNVAGLDQNGYGLSMGKFSLFQISPISTQKRNSDNPYDPEEINGLPPIPGSAPPILSERRNPFDFHFDHPDGNSNTMEEGPGHLQFIPGQQRLMSSHTFKGFSSDPFSVDIKEERLSTKLPPYFVPEKLISGEASYSAYAHFQRQMNDSNLSSVPESISTVPDQEHEEGLVESESITSVPDMNQDYESMAVFDSEQEVREINLGSCYDGIHNSSATKLVENNGVSTTFEIEEIKCEELPISHTPQLEEPEEELYENLYSSSSNRVSTVDFAKPVADDSALINQKFEEMDERQRGVISYSSLSPIETSTIDRDLLEPLLSPDKSLQQDMFGSYSAQDKDLATERISQWIEGDVKQDASRDYNDELEGLDYLTFGASRNEQLPLNEFSVQPSNFNIAELAVTILAESNNSDVMNNETKEMEHILSELDVVGDFGVGNFSLTGNQNDRVQFHAYSNEFDGGYSNVILEANSPQEFVSSSKQPNEGIEHSGVEVQTELHEVEVCLAGATEHQLEQITEVNKQLTEMEVHSNLEEPEVHFEVGDLGSTQFSAATVEHVPTDDTEKINTEQLPEIKAESREGLDLAMKQLFEKLNSNPEKTVSSTQVSSELGAAESHMEHIMGVHSTQSSETTSFSGEATISETVSSEVTETDEQKEQDVKVHSHEFVSGSFENNNMPLKQPSERTNDIPDNLTEQNNVTTDMETTETIMDSDISVV